MVTQERVEYQIRAMDEPVVTVAEVVEALDEDVSDTHVRQKMDLLGAAGKLESKKPGARSKVYWHTERVNGPVAAPADHPDQTGLDEQPVSETPQEAAQEAEQDTTGSTPAMSVEEAAGFVDMPGGGDKEEDRREAFTAVLRHLRDGGPAKADELNNVSYNDFETHYESQRSWWKNAASPALKMLRGAGAVELEDQARGIWKWTGAEAV